VTNTARVIWLGLGLLPYLSLVGVDAWMHERARTVPALERVIHYTSAVALFAFIAGAFLGRDSLALSSLLVFLVLQALDEFGFHRGIARNERRVHIAAYGALVIFIAVWQWTDGRS
jgi:hypothetical protein